MTVSWSTPAGEIATRAFTLLAITLYSGRWIWASAVSGLASARRRAVAGGQA